MLLRKFLFLMSVLVGSLVLCLGGPILYIQLTGTANGDVPMVVGLVAFLCINATAAKEV